MTQVVFTDTAHKELEDAVRFYEIEYSGLGLRFKEEVRKAVMQVAAYPLVILAAPTIFFANSMPFKKSA